MSKVKLSVSVADNHLDRMAEVIQNLRAAGMKIEQSLEQLGIVTGICDSTQVNQLS